MFERVEKEYLGYHIAVYACEMGELGDQYLGHYKLFAKRPRNFWAPGHFAADTVAALECSGKRALQLAKDLAQQKIRTLLAPPGVQTEAPAATTVHGPMRPAATLSVAAPSL